MMDSLIRKLAKPSRLVGMILMFAAAAFGVILAAADFGGGFMPVVGQLVLLVFNLALIGVIPLLLALKKDELIPYALAPLFSYWIIGSIIDYIGSARRVASGYLGLVIAASLFEFFIGCALLAVVVMLVIYFFTANRRFVQIAFFTWMASGLFFFLAWVLWLAGHAKYGGDWTSYINLFYNYLFLPFGLMFVVLHYLIGKAPEEAAPQTVPSTQESDTPNDADPTVAEDSTLSQKEQMSATESVSTDEEQSAATETAPAEAQEQDVIEDGGETLEGDKKSDDEA